MSFTLLQVGELMALRFYVGAYWGPRQESLDDCADRASRFLSGLVSLHPIFQSWYLQGASRSDGLKQGVVGWAVHWMREVPSHLAREERCRAHTAPR